MLKSFTLVEMLVVIVTLGILSTIMLLSSIEAVSSADASNIINNMQQIKMAAYAWYKDNLSRIIQDKNSGYVIRTKGKYQVFSEFIRAHKAEILQYIDNTSSIKLYSKNEAVESIDNIGDYMLTAMENTKKWYICCYLGDTSEIISKYGSGAPELRIKKKVAGRAKTLQLSGLADKNNDSMTAEVYSDQIFVCMLILQLP